MRTVVSSQGVGVSNPSLRQRFTVIPREGADTGPQFRIPHRFIRNTNKSIESWAFFRIQFHHDFFAVSDEIPVEIVNKAIKLGEVDSDFSGTGRCSFYGENRSAFTVLV